MEIQEIPEAYQKFLTEIQKVVVGQTDVIKKLFLALLCKGHVLIVGVPGLAKTTVVNSFSKALDLEFNRVQFTPDLMPSDIIGTEILQETSTHARELKFNKGPVFTNILLADEINRTPPKTQSALLQAMQEGIVTVSGKTEKLSPPFMVMATQNPIEQEGTYPLPEAQLDRFLFSINITYPSEKEEIEIAKKHSHTAVDNISPVFHRESILSLQKAVFDMTVSNHIYNTVVEIVRATRPGGSNKIDLINSYVSWGAGPRASMYLILAAKANALLSGRPTPIEKDVVEVLPSVLNHRILLNFQAEADGISAKDILEKLPKF